MRRTFLLAALGLFAVQPAYAQTIGGNVQVLHSTEGSTVISPEYNWRSGECGGFRFVDIYPNGGPVDFLTNHAVDCNVVGPTFGSAEVGATNLGQTVKMGFGVAIPVPGTRFFRVTAYPIVNGGGDRPQVKITWLSKDLDTSKILKGTSVYTGGFWRIRDKAPDVAQPQVWVKSDLPFEIGVEAARFGKTTEIYVAVKFNFK